MPEQCVEIIRFSAGGNELAGRLTLPSGPGPHPAVVFVHGSGSTSREGRGTYLPLFDEFAMRGLASLSWDKPGVGESTGNWMFQSFDDRATEVSDAIKYLRSRADIDPTQIGMWGISQAGWVMPKVCAVDSDVAFVIAVSVPAGTVAEQDVFRVMNTMPADGYSEDQTDAAIEVMRLGRQMLQSGASFEELYALHEKHKDERWASLVGGEPHPAMVQFARQMFAQDAAPDITTFTCPVLTLFGEKDRIVDVSESTDHYERVLAAAGNEDVSVKIFPNANHGIMLADTGGQEESARMSESGNWTHAPGYLETMGEWVEARVK